VTHPEGLIARHVAHVGRDRLRQPQVVPPAPVDDAPEPQVRDLVGEDHRDEVVVDVCNPVRDCLVDEHEAGELCGHGADGRREHDRDPLGRAREGEHVLVVGDRPVGEFAGPGEVGCAR
jgi:hypothetical protein